MIKNIAYDRAMHDFIHNSMKEFVKLDPILGQFKFSEIPIEQKQTYLYENENESSIDLQSLEQQFTIEPDSIINGDTSTIIEEIYNMSKNLIDWFQKEFFKTMVASTTASGNMIDAQWRWFFEVFKEMLRTMNFDFSKENPLEGQVLFSAPDGPPAKFIEKYNQMTPEEKARHDKEIKDILDQRKREYEQKRITRKPLE